MAATIEPPCRRLFAVESKQNLSNLELSFLKIIGTFTIKKRFYIKAFCSPRTY